MLIKLPNGRFAITADASSSPPTASDTAAQTFTAIGYRQTKKSAMQGGKANANGFRFRPASMKDLAASFGGKVFITAHDRGDVRARGGTIVTARVDEQADEQLMLFDIEASAQWAIEGLKNGTIDRFSFGVMPAGEVTCTAHGTPVWTSCMCCPGELVSIKSGKSVVDVIAEWEYEGGVGLELSAVNVPAVEGTGIVASAGATEQSIGLEDLTLLCGHARPVKASAVPEQVPAAPPAITSPAPTDLDIELVQARARIKSLEAEALATHIDRELARVRSSTVIPADIAAELRASALTAGREGFDRSLRLVERSSAPIGMLLAPAIGHAPVLMSSSTPAVTPGTPTFGVEGPDAFEQTRANPNLPVLMRGCGVSVDDIRKHGSRKFNHEPRLQDAIDATNARGDAMGTLPK